MNFHQESIIKEAFEESKDTLSSGEAGAFLKFVESNLEDNGYEIILNKIERK